MRNEDERIRAELNDVVDEHEMGKRETWNVGLICPTVPKTFAMKTIRLNRI